MYQIDNSTAAASQPASTPAGPAGFFTDGNPAGGVPATILPAEWLNSVMMELLGVVAAAGVVPAKNQFNQLLTSLTRMYSPVVGDARNARMKIAAASANATFSADQIVVASSLGGQTYQLGNFSQAINLATNGAGGMDTGAAPTNGFVGLYGIHNPVSGARALLGVNATSATLPEVYGGANMPAGYTASALVSVWPTNGSGQLVIGNQTGRRINRESVTVFNGSSITGGSLATISTASAAPRNAKRVAGLLSAINTTVNTTQTVAVAADGFGSGIQQLVGQCSIVGNGNAGNFTIDTPSTQTLWFATGNGGGGTPTFTIAISGYEF